MGCHANPGQQVVHPIPINVIICVLLVKVQVLAKCDQGLPLFTKQPVYLHGAVQTQPTQKLFYRYFNITNYIND